MSIHVPLCAMPTLIGVRVISVEDRIDWDCQIHINHRVISVSTDTPWLYIYYDIVNDKILLNDEWVRYLAMDIDDPEVHPITFLGRYLFGGPITPLAIKEINPEIQVTVLEDGEMDDIYRAMQENFTPQHLETVSLNFEEFHNGMF